MKPLLFLCFCLPFLAIAQPNCEVFLFNKDTLQYKACKMSEVIDGKYYQFSREFHEAFDSTLQICPYFAYAYREKSVAYLKSGDFLNWKKLIDKAVQYDPQGNLGYRGWCRYQFFRDYKGAISDFEQLETTITTDIGYSADGEYQLAIAKGMCYSALNQKEKAIEIFEKQLKAEGYSVRLYDYYQLGVTYFEVKDYENALKCLEKQSTINEFAENEYYKAKIHKTLNHPTEYQKHKQLALNLYQEKRRLFDSYTHHSNKVFYETMQKD
jgi:tetratricopeptide (TPR) repeat protein